MPFKGCIRAKCPSTVNEFTVFTQELIYLFYKKLKLFVSCEFSQPVDTQLCNMRDGCSRVFHNIFPAIDY